MEHCFSSDLFTLCFSEPLHMLSYGREGTEQQIGVTGSCPCLVLHSLCVLVSSLTSLGITRLNLG